MKIDLSYTNYKKCEKCKTTIPEEIEHSEKDCRKNQMENYIKNRINKGVIKGVIYSLLIIYTLGAGSLITVLLKTISHLVKLNEELTETNNLDKRIMSAYAEAQENINNR